MSGRRIVDMVKENLKPSDILTSSAFENAIRTNGAIGGSTNAVLHLLALAGRVGVDLTLDDWDRSGPRCSDHRQSAAVGQVSDGGVLLCRRSARRHEADCRNGSCHKDAITVTGEAVWEGLKDNVNYNDDVILPAEKALTASGGIAVLRGNLAPQGAVLKPSAALASADGAHAVAPSCLKASKTITPASTCRNSTSTRPASWC